MGTRGMVAAALLALAATGGATGAGAAPFQMAGDGPERIWLLDQGTGLVQRCGLTVTVGPRVIDVFGAQSQARPDKTYPARPDCAVAVRSTAGGDGDRDPWAMVRAVQALNGTVSVAVAPGMLGDGSSGVQEGVGFGMLGTGTWSVAGGGWGNQVIIAGPAGWMGFGPD